MRARLSFLILNHLLFQPGPLKRLKIADRLGNAMVVQRLGQTLARVSETVTF
jgi:hypothetical protein